MKPLSLMQVNKRNMEIALRAEKLGLESSGGFVQVTFSDSKLVSCSKWVDCTAVEPERLLRHLFNFIFQEGLKTATDKEYDRKNNLAPNDELIVSQR